MTPTYVFPDKISYIHLYAIIKQKLKGKFLWSYLNNIVQTINIPRRFYGKKKYNK